MRVEIGNLVELKDGRIVLVTDASVEELNIWEHEGGSVCREENILIGFLYDGLNGWNKDNVVTVVTDMSEVARIIE